MAAKQGGFSNRLTKGILTINSTDTVAEPMPEHQTNFVFLRGRGAGKQSDLTSHAREARSL